MRILIISYVYAPDRAPRAYRWTAIAEHWARQGHAVEIIAGWKSGDARVETRAGVDIRRVGGGILERLRGALGQGSHRVPASPHGAGTAAASGGAKPALRGAARALYAATLRPLYWPDYAFHWFAPALAAARRACRARQFDAVISVSHPFTPHLVALALGRGRRGPRWIADIGDPFSALAETPLNNPALYRRLNRRAEAAVVAAADAIAVTVGRCRDDYATQFPASIGKTAIIPPLLSLPQAAAGPAMTLPGGGRHLVFIGTLYRALRNPSPLLALVRALVREGADLQLHLFGAIHDCADCFVPFERELGGHLHRHGVVPREAIAGALAAADILVNIGNATTHQLPSKLVEYAAAGRPILNLASGPADTAQSFLARYPAALTLRAPPEPDAATIAAARAFIAAPPPVDRGAVDRFLAPYAIERVAAGYEALIAGRVGEDPAAGAPVREYPG